MFRVPRPRATERPAYTLDSLTDVAVRIFIARGYDATRMDHIARAANIGVPALYHHVPNKEALLEHALDRILTALLGVFDEPEAQTGEPYYRLIHITRRIIAVQFRLRSEAELLIRLKGNTKMERRALERRQTIDDKMVELAHQAQASGHLRSDLDGRMMVRLTIGTCNSVVDWFREDGTWSEREVTDSILAFLADGGRTR